ncbi:MAG: 5-methyltetrahydropteroyltriglutamate--homocysteine S-methyltransferase [Gammaproteobacteria bacterium]|nr:5-methyltetrahydropteroyltriglutamate--homocysteine S-methyltransferase [Gammaproteobacteria bacterium]
MTISHNLGFPRIGAQRALKFALEAYWNHEISLDALEAVGAKLRASHWQLQSESGLDFVPVGDFSWYDHVLDMSCTLGVVPQRFLHSKGQHSTGKNSTRPVSLDDYFAIARGVTRDNTRIAAGEMTKWFDTNYHYIVPELTEDQTFNLHPERILNEIEQAQRLGHKVKPVILGPMTFLWLAKAKGTEFNKLSLLDDLVDVYGQLIDQIQQQGIEWLQIDEPILALDLPQAWQNAFQSTYNRLQFKSLKILVASYFGALQDNLKLACQLPTQGLHIDAVTDAQQVSQAIDLLPEHKVLSVGIINGRNIWRNDLSASSRLLAAAQKRLQERLWIAPSCSLLHVPLDLNNEPSLDDELKSWLAFACQKLEELQLLKLHLLKSGLNDKTAVQEALTVSDTRIKNKKSSTRIHHLQDTPEVTAETLNRKSVFAQRAKLQKKKLQLPLYPTTTIGSFPQTKAIRADRLAYKKGAIDTQEYTQRMQQEIAEVIKKQEALGLDVLVHGEAERNDMVEYFAHQLEGFAFTDNGWVQSYGSRCVKPPIIFGDVSRPKAITVEWTQFAQSCTDKPMKGMLTGPVTIINWSFVRDDQSHASTALQIALALRHEVLDLEAAGIRIIQIDEAALREGLPLRKKDWGDYLQWAVNAFKLMANGVKDDTQIHTHMCYSDFNDIIESIAEMDADVITIETSRSDMALLDAFQHFNYPNAIGPGVYDIHSANVPREEDIIHLIQMARQKIAPEQLWINPDCGLKTRNWPEVEAALKSMVSAAKALRVA